jgi:hypothetical protein
VTRLPPPIPPGTPPPSGIPTGDQLIYFCSLLAGGLFFLFLAFFVFLPVIILAPSKFALAFTIGNCLVLSAFAALKGWRKQAAQMLARDRLPFTAGYLGSVLLTLYASILLKSYLLSLGASALQVRRCHGPCRTGRHHAGGGGVHWCQAARAWCSPSCCLPPTPCSLSPWRTT